MRTEYTEHSLSSILAYFAKDFTPKSGEKIFRCEAVAVDQAKDKVVFRLFIEEAPDNRPG